MAGLVTMLVPSALRRRSDIREVEPEVVSRGEQKPWVVQLLAEGQLPGVNAEPLPHAVEAEQIPEEEPPAAQPVVDQPRLVEVEPEPEPEPVAEIVEPAPEPVPPAPPVVDQPTLVEVAPEPEPDPEPEPVAEIVEPAPEPVPVAAPPQQEAAPPAEERTQALPPKPMRKRARTKHRPVKRAPAPERVAAHVPATAEVEATEPHAEEVPSIACEIRLWRGYRKANFFACVFSDDGEPLAVAESPFFRAYGNGVPDKTDEAVAALDALHKKLEDNGWQRASAGKTWYGAVYRQPA